MIVLLFAAASALGAIVRHRVNRFGLGAVATLAVNVTGAFVLGLLVSSGASADAITILGTGFCGTLTTFSTFSLEACESRRRNRLLIVGGTLTLGLLAACLGAATGSTIG